MDDDTMRIFGAPAGSGADVTEKYPIEVIVQPGSDWRAWLRREDEAPCCYEILWYARRVQPDEVWYGKEILDMICEVLDDVVVDNIGERMFANWDDPIFAPRKDAVARLERQLRVCVESSLFELAPGLDPETGERTDG